MKSLLILCQPDDAAAYRLAACCQHHGLPTRVVTGAALAAAPAWHVATGTAGTDWRIRLADGTVLAKDTVGGVYCRLLSVPGPYHFVAPEDTEYAATEWQALVAGWLRNAEVPLLCPVSPVLLAHAPANHWLQLAQLAEAGLPVPAAAALTAPHRWGGLAEIPFSAARPEWHHRAGVRLHEPLPDELTTALVVGETVLYAPEEAFRAPLHRLQTALGVPVFAVPFARAPDGGWRAVGYHFRPDWTTDEAAEAFVQLAKSQLAPADSVPQLVSWP